MHNGFVMRTLFRSVLLVLALCGLLACQPGHEGAARDVAAGQAASGVDAVSGLPLVASAELPREAQETLAAIKRGGPYAYDRDGVVFGNYERVLPKRPRGYYHEYTVKTPGVRTRGARRIISGDVAEYYYTTDHYQSFKRIRE
ncbi:MAG: ribonuclease domain-containing protein [Gallionella sp.]|nr:ribonuclease domain-containing protein [Gallionella sp.]MDD4946370.1 ribonuclease domain-containing protein [Gallionella sp.]